MGLHRERDEDLENDLNKGALWAVTYGDIMSYLMILFLILFSLSLRGGTGLAKSLGNLQGQFGGAKRSEAIERLDERGREAAAAEEMRNKLFGRGLQQFVTVDVSETRIQVTLSEPIVFGSGDAALKPQAHGLLTEFAESVKELPSPIVVEGHTDDKPVLGGRYRDNWELSTARAVDVVRFLVDKQGLDPRRVSASGFGSNRPVADNGTAEGRAANRRIEISLLRRQ